MNFASDNASGVHPDIMAALLAANGGHLPSYGGDPLTERAEARLRALFQAPDARVVLIGTGTGANGLALGQLCPPYGRIFCHESAHIETSEAGAPGFFTGGAQLALIAGAAGRITPEGLQARLADYPQGDAHDGLNAVLSLTNATEWGGVYTPAQVEALTAIAREAGLRVHMDGARLANALAATGASPADMTWRAGVDAVCLGGTKNGCMALEALIFFNPDHAQGLDFRRLRAGHLWSKHRFLAAQALAWLNDDLWLRLAGHANAMAARLAKAGEQVAPVEANEVFLRLPRLKIRALRAKGLRAADWPAPGDNAEYGTIRLVTSWATIEDEVTALLDALA